MLPCAGSADFSTVTLLRRATSGDAGLRVRSIKQLASSGAPCLTQIKGNACYSGKQLQIGTVDVSWQAAGFGQWKAQHSENGWPNKGAASIGMSSRNATKVMSW